MQNTIKIPALCNFGLCDLSDHELAARVSAGMEQVYESGKVPARRVPADPNSELDLLIGEMTRRFLGKDVAPGDFAPLREAYYAGKTMDQFHAKADELGEAFADLRANQEGKV